MIILFQSVMSTQNWRVPCSRSAKPVVASPQCPPKSSAKSPARAAGLPTKRAPPTNGQPRKLVAPAARGVRPVAAAAASSPPSHSGDRKLSVFELIKGADQSAPFLFGQIFNRMNLCIDGGRSRDVVQQ